MADLKAFDLFDNFAINSDGTEDVKNKENKQLESEVLTAFGNDGKKKIDFESGAKKNVDTQKEINAGLSEEQRNNEKRKKANDIFGNSVKVPKTENKGAGVQLINNLDLNEDTSLISVEKQAPVRLQENEVEIVDNVLEDERITGIIPTNIIYSRLYDDLKDSADNENVEESSSTELATAVPKGDKKEEKEDEGEKEEAEESFQDSIKESFMGLAGSAKLFLSKQLNKFKSSKIEARFKKCREYTSGDFSFKMNAGEAIITKYLGSSRVIVIPSAINLRNGSVVPVRYLHSDFLYGSMLRNYNTRQIANALSTDISRASSSISLSDIDEVVLPESLFAIFGKSFWTCSGIVKLVVPSTVVYIAPDAFENSGIRDLYLNCEKPNGFSREYFSMLDIHVAANVANSYEV